jgi:hypothetical protein
MNMDVQNPPEINITIHEHHDVKGELVEYVARLLCRANGCDPDADMRCSADPGQGNTVSCLAINWPYPAYLGWNKYREPAEKLLAQIFGPCVLPGITYPGAGITVPTNPLPANPLLIPK